MAAMTNLGKSGRGRLHLLADMLGHARIFVGAAKRRSCQGRRELRRIRQYRHVTLRNHFSLPLRGTRTNRPLVARVRVAAEKPCFGGGVLSTSIAPCSVSHVGIRPGLFF
jgi:hypothetical protein